MTRIGRSCLVIVIAIASQAREASAEQGDAAAARELLKQGYTLKADKKLDQALPVLLESYRLAPELKTLINVADCLEGLGRYTEAQERWVTARDRAAGQGNAMIRKEAERRLSELEPRMPRLTIVLSPEAPPGTEVRRDGVLLGNVSLGTALPTDPGKHMILVTASGRADRTFEVTLTDRQNERTEVAPGDPAPEAPTREAGPPIVPPPPPAPAPPAPQAAESLPPADSGGHRGDVQRWLGIGAGGLGVVALGVATATWLSAKSKHDDAVTNHCPNSRCTQEAFDLQSQASHLVTLTNVAAISGAALIAGGAAVYFTAPRRSQATASAGPRAMPVFGPGFAGVVVSRDIE